MATFPESSPVPQYPLIVSPRWDTLISTYSRSNERRRKKALYAQFDVTVNYEKMTQSDASNLWEFYMDKCGALTSFYIYDLSLLMNHTFIHKSCYMATGDGSTTTFDIPGRSTSSITIYGNNNDETANGTKLTGGGTSDSDRFQFNTAPVEGVLVTCDFAGYLRLRVRFQDDNLDRENFMTNLYTYGGIKLRGLSPI